MNPKKQLQLNKKKIHPKVPYKWIAFLLPHPKALKNYVPYDIVDLRKQLIHRDSFSWLFDRTGRSSKAAEIENAGLSKNRLSKIAHNQLHVTLWELKKIAEISNCKLHISFIPLNNLNEEEE